MELENVVEEALALGCEYCDVRHEKSEINEIIIKNKNLESAVSGAEECFSLRVLYKGSWGFFSSDNIDGLKDAPERCIKISRANPKRGKGKVKLACVKSEKGKKTIRCKEKAWEIPIEDKFKFALEVPKRVLMMKGIKSMTLKYWDERCTRKIITSDGIDVSSTVPRTFMQVNIVAVKDGKSTSYRHRIGGTRGFEIFRKYDPIEGAIKSAESALRILEGIKAPSGKFPVIADPNLTGVFAHEAVGHASEGDLVTSGESILEGKKGRKVASSIVTLIDDPTYPGAFGSFIYDDEGVKGEKKYIIKNGFLRKYILNRETAAILGMRPNGGARSEDFTQRPLVRMSNTYIEKGDWKFEEMVEEIKYGIYAIGTRGGQVDTAKGSFQFSCQEAYLIENGEITKPLRNLALSGMTLEIMKSINAVGKNMNLGEPGFCGKEQLVPVGDGGPHIRIKEAIVGGG